MGYAAIGEDAHNGPWMVVDPDGWQFVSHRGSPQQVYGEPFPTSDWIVGKVRAVYAARQSRQYPQADALRQWLRDYGIEVEYERDRVRARW